MSIYLIKRHLQSFKKFWSKCISWNKDKWLVFRTHFWLKVNFIINLKIFNKWILQWVPSKGIWERKTQSLENNVFQIGLPGWVLRSSRPSRPRRKMPWVGSKLVQDTDRQQFKNIIFLSIFALFVEGKKSQFSASTHLRIMDTRMSFIQAQDGAQALREMSVSEGVQGSCTWHVLTNHLILGLSSLPICWVLQPPHPHTSLYLQSGVDLNRVCSMEFICLRKKSFSCRIFWEVLNTVSTPCRFTSYINQKNTVESAVYRVLLCLGLLPTNCVFRTSLYSSEGLAGLSLARTFSQPPWQLPPDTASDCGNLEQTFLAALPDPFFPSFSLIPILLIYLPPVMHHTCLRGHRLSLAVLSPRATTSCLGASLPGPG